MGVYVRRRGHVWTWACVGVCGYGCVRWCGHVRGRGQGATETGLGAETGQLERLSSTLRLSLSLVCGRYFHSFNKCLWETCPLLEALQLASLLEGPKYFGCGYRNCGYQRWGAGVG